MSMEHLLATVSIDDQPLELVAARYPHDGALAVYLRQPGERMDEPLFAVLSTNLRSYGVEHADDEFPVKTYSENAGLAPQVFATGLFEDTGRMARSGFVAFPIWRCRTELPV